MVEKNNKRHLCALDIGSSKVVALIGEAQSHDEIHIIGIGEAESRGVKQGLIVDIGAASQAIKHAIEEAENMVDARIQSVVIGIGGNHIQSMNSSAKVRIKDGEVNRSDIERVLENARAVSIPQDHQILRTVTQEYVIDNIFGIKEPLGMSGTSLEARIHIVTGAITAIQNTEKCIQRLGLNLHDEPHVQSLASAIAVLTDEDKNSDGVCCIDIGAETTDIAVFTNGAIRHNAVIPLGGEHITKDIAMHLKTPKKAAEFIKKVYGAATDTLEDLDEMIEVPGMGDRAPCQTSRKTLSLIIKARLIEIFSIIWNELDRAGFSEEQLLNGIILTGGTSLMTGIVDLAESEFNLPVMVGVPREAGGLSDRIRNPRYATAVGLLYESFSNYFEYQETASSWDGFVNFFVELKNKLF